MSEQEQNPNSTNVDIKNCSYLSVGDGIRIYLCDCKKHTGILYGCVQIDEDSGEIDAVGLVDLPYDAFVQLGIQTVNVLCRTEDRELNIVVGDWHEQPR